MAKFYGNVGYAVSIETAPGIWEERIVEKPYFGDVVQNSRRLKEGENLNHDIFLTNALSILADAYMHNHFFAIRYVMWAGAPWIVDNVEVKSPRLTLRLGSLYNGPQAAEDAIYGSVRFNVDLYGEMK